MGAGLAGEGAGLADWIGGPLERGRGGNQVRHPIFGQLSRSVWLGS